MTLQVCRKSGQPRVVIGWNLLRQWQHGMISIGQADPFTPPEERELTDQQATFDRLTAQVYEAYARGETFNLEIAEQFGTSINLIH